MTIAKERAPTTTGKQVNKQRPHHYSGKTQAHTSEIERSRESTNAVRTLTQTESKQRATEIDGDGERPSGA
jgi:hypothetical protein